MTNQPQLHSSIVAMISLASGIASKHPDMGLCQLERLRETGIPEHQIDAVIEIARHIRDEATQKMDAVFDEKAKTTTTAAEPVIEESCDCTATPGGQSCC